MKCIINNDSNVERVYELVDVKVEKYEKIVKVEFVFQTTSIIYEIVSNSEEESIEIEKYILKIIKNCAELKISEYLQRHYITIICDENDLSNARRFTATRCKS